MSNSKELSPSWETATWTLIPPGPTRTTTPLELWLCWTPELKQLRKDRKGNTHFDKFCFFSQYFTVDIASTTGCQRISILVAAWAPDRWEATCWTVTAETPFPRPLGTTIPVFSRTCHNILRYTARIDNLVISYLKIVTSFGHRLFVQLLEFSSMQLSPQLTPKGPSTESRGATQQAIANTPSK
jgi:hypothetical protein